MADVASVSAASVIAASVGAGSVIFSAGASVTTLAGICNAGFVTAVFSSHMKLLGVVQDVDESPILLKVAQSPLSEGCPAAQSRAGEPLFPFQEKPLLPNGCRSVKISAKPKAGGRNLAIFSDRAIIV
jgi:hypothetical protein